ncbi:hypothetical protein GIB67_019950 [Kingdonia uniflora]|uniref:Uncharacterized protein n=1 Tax=Kingdonia uniflora TaxID=39325 RepID=A0A7J7MKV0_9MAGN|nr:hypothetical protein GIB67_019950 [Kingdonia uniflora]
MIQNPIKQNLYLSVIVADNLPIHILSISTILMIANLLIHILSISTIYPSIYYRFRQ